MKVPDYIAKALTRRAKSSASVFINGNIIDEFLDKNNIEIESYDRADGAETFANPYDSIDRITKAIEEKEDDRKLG